MRGMLPIGLLSKRLAKVLSLNHLILPLIAEDAIEQERGAECKTVAHGGVAEQAPRNSNHAQLLPMATSAAFSSASDSVASGTNTS